MAHNTSTALPEKEIAVVPPTRLNVRICSADVVCGATMVVDDVDGTEEVDDVDDVDSGELSGAVVAAVEPVVTVGALVVVTASSER